MKYWIRYKCSLLSSLFPYGGRDFIFIRFFLSFCRLNKPYLLPEKGSLLQLLEKAKKMKPLQLLLRGCIFL